MVNTKKRYAPKISHTREELSASRVNQKEDFKNEVCQVFDLLVGAGLDPIEAIRKTRSTLKANNYPNVTYDVVMASLRAAGKLRKNPLEQRAVAHH